MTLPKKKTIRWRSATSEFILVDTAVCQSSCQTLNISILVLRVNPNTYSRLSPIMCKRPWARRLGEPSVADLLSSLMLRALHSDANWNARDNRDLQRRETTKYVASSNSKSCYSPYCIIVDCRPSAKSLVIYDSSDSSDTEDHGNHPTPRTPPQAAARDPRMKCVSSSHILCDAYC